MNPIKKEERCTWIANETTHAEPIHKSERDKFTGRGSIGQLSRMLRVANGLVAFFRPMTSLRER